MESKLFLEWLEEEVEDINEAMLLWGVCGLLERFEDWLKREGHIRQKSGWGY